MFKRTTVLIYGVLSYVVFFATFLYAIGFIGNFLVPKSIDSPAEAPLWFAMLVNSLLLGIFAVQHSVMARPAFKRWITRFIPPAAERSTYTLTASLLLIAVFIGWQPMGGVIWNVTDPVGQAVLYGLYAFGWTLVLIATFLINHFDLFGLRQVWLEFTGRHYTPLRFKTPGPYRLVRHPLYVGWLFVFWATPTMTAAHLLFALLTTGYILIGIRLEERDLLKAHPEYAGYRRHVPMLIPRLGGQGRGGRRVTPAGNES
ncbi:methanethiol S-methyltransferase [Thioalkalicoccus limnaeus]|uniref:methanethiol S-methyltransferase n=1 Tax=Thioalkalicoccus limnaeus TaxID=120681 RepID=A0ABV4BEP2_9GAMM